LIVQSDGFFEHAVSTSAGSLSPRTRWKDLAEYKFALPPKDQQRRIAEILRAADSAVETARRAITAVVEFKDSLVSDFLTQGWRNVRGSIETAGIPPSSPPWEYLSCRDLLAEGPRNGYSGGPSAEGYPHPTLSIGAVRNGHIVIDGNIKYAEIPEVHLETYRLRRGDLLIVRGNGNKNLVGKCGLVGEVPVNCFYPDLLIRVSFREAKIRQRFACLQWNSQAAHRRLLSRAKSTNGIWKINGKDMEEHRLLVPPLDEQDALLCKVQAIEATEMAALRRLAAVTDLRNALLNDLLDTSLADV
jgi:type I restriction enzyme S subunit